MSDDREYMSPDVPLGRKLWDPIKGDWAVRPRSRSKSCRRRLIASAPPGECYLCFKPRAYFQMVVEHRVPLSRGGSNRLHNLAFACPECDKEKGSLTEQEYRAVLKLRDGIITESDSRLPGRSHDEE